MLPHSGTTAERAESTSECTVSETLIQRKEQSMTQEVEIDICCDVLRDAIEGGGIQVVETEPGTYVEVIPDEDGETAIQINFCPFCGAQRVAEPDEEYAPQPDGKS
jgi:hypothetical protein